MSHEIGTLPAFLSASAPRFLGTPSFAAFYERLDSLEHERVATLWRAVQALQGGDEDAAAAVMDTLVRALPDENDAAGALAVRTFGEALLSRARRLSGSGGNLYLDARPPGAQLRAFELLRLRTPLIPFGYAAGNRALTERVREEGGPVDVTLVDVGIGRGGQVRSLLKNPSARSVLRSLHVVGIEPDSATGGRGALEHAAETVRQTGEEVSVPTTFHAIAKRAEDLTVEDLRAAGLRGLVIGSCTLSLHHVLGDDEALSGREDVLALLREAGVQAVVLVEPDSNHFDDDLAVRFLYAYRHYRTLSRSLHAMLSPSNAELVWNEFFAPEVLNVMGHDGRQRTERHEESQRWLERLGRAGWSTDALPDLVPQAAAPAGFTVGPRGGAFTLSYEGVGLLSVLRARAR